MSGSERGINGFTPRQIQRMRNETFCSDPGFLRLNHEMLSRFHPQWFRSWFSRFLYRPYVVATKNQLLYGDRSPAIVVSQSPLIVAAYSEEIDGVAMLQFSPQEVPAHLVQVGQRLVTLNFDYSSLTRQLASDLTFGERSPQRWYNFLPLIGDFLSDEQHRLAELKASVPESWWGRTAEMAYRYDPSLGLRNGRPGCAMQPSVGSKRWKFLKRGF